MAMAVTPKEAAEYRSQKQKDQLKRLEKLIDETLREDYYYRNFGRKKKAKW